MSRIIILIPILTLCALLYLQVKTTIEKNTVNLIEAPVPYFDLEEMSFFSPGKKRISSDNLAELSDNDILMVNFFASWCTTCVLEQKQIDALSKDHDIDIIGIAYKDKPTDINRYMTKRGNPYTHIALDDKGYAAAGWRIRGTPESFFLDSSGKIRYHHKGPIREKDLTEKIIPALKAIKETQQQGEQS
ncbi:MAG: redoxin family protein [Alcanivorax sp.]